MRIIIYFIIFIQMAISSLMGFQVLIKIMIKLISINSNKLKFDKNLLLIPIYLIHLIFL